MTHPELEAEQAYVDHDYACLERMRKIVGACRAAKGLEFDHVIVADREQGLRELYVALTRPTTTLVVIYARPLPAELQLTG